MKCVGGGMCQLGNSHYPSVPADLEYTHLEFIESHVGLEKKMKRVILSSSLQIEQIQGLTTAQAQFLIAVQYIETENANCSKSPQIVL